MILNSAPDNKAILGGVATVSEFRIRNSAKAFGILSSGLYANKIRAIIRELGCNAVDSHVAAGKREVPFDLHLPTQLRPYFSIRDYGTGLSHSEVTNIYTTYFESTKTQSNDFIGALGLGSKSPFSYTDNFTVIAIKNGIKGVYSAFINDEGVPAVALMSQDETDEPAGVEVKFAVVERDDFYRFQKEASTVFTYFSVKPNFTGAEVAVEEVEYQDRDIIPGVHQRTESRYHGKNRAIMGNIAYPIDIPTKQTALGDFDFVDENGLDIFFEIGEIEFQASREGLQYTEATLAAIKKKYEAVAEVVYKKFEVEADAFTNAWERSRFVVERSRNRLWAGAAKMYSKRKKLPFVDGNYHGGLYLESLKLDVKELETKLNIKIREFETDSNYGYSSNSPKIAREINPNYDQKISVENKSTTSFVINTKNEKIWERSRWHFKNSVKENSNVYVIYAADVSKPVLIDDFFKLIHNPPEKQILQVSDLTKPEKIKAESEYRKVTLMRIHFDHYKNEMTWQSETASPKDMDANTVYCYVPVKGYAASNKAGEVIDAKAAYAAMMRSGIKKFKDAKFYGVRKDDLDTVKSLPNWHLFDDFVGSELAKLTSKEFRSVAINAIDKNNSSMYHNKRFIKLLDANSPMRVFCETLPDEAADSNRNVLELAKMLKLSVDVAELEKQATEEVKAIVTRYPMLKIIRNGYYDDPAVVEYIKIVDQHKGMN